VEDEKRLAKALKQILEEQKYMVDIVYDGRDGFDYGVSGIYDIIVLDVMLPVKDGFWVASELRKNKIETPILMLTARDAVSDKVTGLDCGADDYMTKPFAP
jgi:DNA-binding response OmpR family regulator